MLIVLLVAAGLLGRVHPTVIGIGAMAVYEPRFVLLGAAVWGIVSHVRRRRARPGPVTEATFFRSLAAELQSGASLRFAVVSAADRVPGLDLRGAVRLASAGHPVSAIAEDLEHRLPLNGRVAGVAFRLSDWSGARVADTFEELAARADDAAELAREERAAAAQAKLSALIVGVAPIVLTAVLLVTGRGAGLVGRGAVGWIVLAVGAFLELTGLLVVAAMLRRRSA